MPKIRKPRSFAAAITRIMGALTDEGCAEAVGKSASLVRKWADPDVDVLPNVDQAMKLDAAYVNAGFGSGPIGELYAELLKEQAGDPPCPIREIKDCALLFQTRIGTLSATVLDVTSPESAAGEKLSTREYAQVMEVLGEISEQLELTRRAVVENAEGGERG